jgi:nicotinamidase-related amidase
MSIKDLFMPENQTFIKKRDTLDLNVRYYRWFPPEAHLGHITEKLSLDPAKCAFLLVDIYCQWLDKNIKERVAGDKYAQLWYKVTTDHIAPALQSARVLGIPVIYINNSAPNVGLEYSEFANKLEKSLGFDMTRDFTEQLVDPREYHKGDPVQLRFPDVVEPQPTDHFIRKHCYSGFFETRLDSLLRNLGIHNLFFVGFVADACLFTTMADAVFRNYKVVLLRDCTLASELPWEVDDLRQTTRMILWIESTIGVSITSYEFINACNNALSID